MVLELPDWVDNRAILVDEEFVLNCDENWSIFPKMDIDLELEDDKTIVFIYNVVLPLTNKKMTVSIFVNDLLDVRFIYLLFIFLFIYFSNSFLNIILLN
jgi:hypothetical protein